MDEVERIVDRLKEHFRAEKDTDLARILGVDKRTVSSWRARGSVPRRYVELLEGRNHQTILTPPMWWGEYEEQAFNLAVFRIVRLLSGVTRTGGYGSQFDAFRKVFPAFWPFMRDAQVDIASRHDARDMPVQTAFALVIHDDIEAGDAALDRDKERLRAYGFIGLG